MARAEVNGTHLFYVEAGEGEPLVVLHGSWLDHEEWLPVVRQLAPSFRVVAYDRRGHGRSETSGSEGSFTEDAADLEELLEQLGMAPAHVVAHSTGGAIALRLAVRRPELFRSLASHEPPLFATLAGDPRAAPLLERLEGTLEAVEELLARGEHEAAARRFSAAALGPDAWEHELSDADRERMIRNAPTFLEEVRQPERLDLDLTGLGALPFPVLLTEGAKSSPLRGMVATRLTEVLPHVERRVLDGVAHMPQLTDPEGYANVVRDFVSRVLASS